MANAGTGGGRQGRGYGEELPGKYGGEDGGGEHVLGAVARDGVKLSLFRDIDVFSVFSEEPFWCHLGH